MAIVPWVLVTAERDGYISRSPDKSSASTLCSKQLESCIAEKIGSSANEVRDLEMADCGGVEPACGVEPL